MEQYAEASYACRSFKPPSSNDVHNSIRVTDSDDPHSIQRADKMQKVGGLTPAGGNRLALSPYKPPTGERKSK